MRWTQRQKSVQNRLDANILVQLRKFKDLTKDGEVRTDDMKKIKVKRDDAVKVHDDLMSIRASRLNPTVITKIKQISIRSSTSIESCKIREKKNGIMGSI